MFVLDDSQIEFMRNAERVGARLTVADWNRDPGQWRRAWATAWELVGMVHTLAVRQ
jgi:hypothetical protein